MISYYISKISEFDGQYLMHRYACASLPEDEKDYTKVGDFETCDEALIATRLLEAKTKACPYCCRSCSK